MRVKNRRATSTISPLVLCIESAIEYRPAVVRSPLRLKVALRKLVLNDANVPVVTPPSSLRCGRVACSNQIKYHDGSCDGI